MRRKKVIREHPIKPDQKFASLLVARLINKIMRCGEKRKAMKIVYQASQITEEKTSLSPVVVLEGALTNIKPDWELKSRKRGGANYRFPVKIDDQRGLSLALRWLVENARQRKTAAPTFQHLAEEIIDAYNKTGGAFQKKETIHKEAVKNMAFALSSNK